MNKELLKGSSSLLILGLLKGEDMYGYQMIKSIESTSNGIFSLKEGTLYPILHALENEGIIESYWKESEKKRKRKYYSITKEGKKYLKTKEKEWNLFSKTISNVLGGTS